MLNYVVLLAFIFICFLIGRAQERNHYKSIRRRELLHSKIPAITLPKLPASWDVDVKTKATNKANSIVVSGSVMISQDYFKAVMAGLKSILGGRLNGYETLLDRARREAILRMKETARKQGYNTIIGVRFETSSIAGGNRIAGVEVIAYGTAINVVSNQSISM